MDFETWLMTPPVEEDYPELDLDNLDNDDFGQPGEDRYMPEGDWAPL